MGAAAHLTPDNLARALDMQRRCCTQAQIAVTLGVSRETICRALARHNRKVLERLEKRAAATKGQQIAQLEWAAEQAAAAWKRSLDDEETVKTVKGDDGDKKVDKTETTVKGQSGNPALIREIRGSLADIRKILGLDAPPPKPVDPEDTEDYVVDLSPTPPEEDHPQPGDGPAA